MAKIFSFNDKRNGSYIDGVSGDVGVNTNGEWARTEKGLAWRSDGTGYIDYTSINFGTVFSIVIDFKQIDEQTLFISNVGTSNYLYTPSNNELRFRVNSVNSSGLDFSGAPFDDGQWHQLVLTRDGADLTAYMDGVLEDTTTTTETAIDFIIRYISGTPSLIYKGNVNRIIGYDHILTSTERAKLYSEFLNATPIQRSVEDNLDYPALKPKDLSGEPGLVAAYNMIPSPNGKLVDISGNGQNGIFTNRGMVSTNDGIKFPENTGMYLFNTGVTCNPDGDKQFTWIFRFKPYSSGTNLRIASNSTSLKGYEIMFSGNKPKVRIYHATGHEELTFDKAITLNKWNTLIITKIGDIFTAYFNGVIDTPITFTIPILTGVGNLYIARHASAYTYKLDCEIADLKFFNYAWIEQQAIDYHNQFAKEIQKLGNIALDAGVGQDEVSLSGKIVFDSGAFSIHELSAQDANVPQLDKGSKYMLCDTGGSFKIPYTETTSVDARIDYYNGSAWERKEDTLANLITNNSWLSQSGDYLVFTLTAGDAVTSDLIRGGIII